MSKLKKIDELLLFFIFGISFLMVSWWAGVIDLFPENPQTFSEKIDFNSNAEFVFDDKSQVSEIGVLNPDLEIYYSLNGGDSYLNGGGIIDLSHLSNPSITQYQTAWRTNAAHYDLPSVLSLNLFLVNQKTKSRSQKICVTNLNGYISELPVVSINISQEDFIGEINGLYVLGEASWYSDKFNEAWWLREANYTQRGVEWEKKVSFAFLENGKMPFEQKCGIKISGNATRGFPQKSFKIYARQMYGSDFMHYPFFGDSGLDKYESLVLRTSGNDNTRTLFADLMMHKIAEGSKVFVQKGVATQVFINGNYWGIYNLRERISQENLGEYYDCKPEKVTILENSTAELKDGLVEAHDAFHLLVDQTLAKSELTNGDIEALNDEISLKSFMDYMFFETFFANQDWPHNNSTCYKIKNGKWKWALNDLDYALAYPGDDNVNTNMFVELTKSNAIIAQLFNKLIENEKFKKDFIKRSKENIEEYIDIKAAEVYEKSKESLEKAIPDHIKRWRSIQSVAQWNVDCERNLSFLNTRIQVYKEHLKAL